MPVKLDGSCRCGAARFSVQSHSPYPYQLCYCTICRKTAGGGGFAINIMGTAKSLQVAGEEAIGLYRAEICDDDGKNCEISSAQRRYCTRCGTALWLFDPAWPELVHPFASAIDSKLPVPPVRTHLMLRYKAKWVEPVIGPQDLAFDLYPEQSIEAWHKSHGLWIA
jgi:hypothetical protein